jgi:hypothetical protein
MNPAETAVTSKVFISHSHRDRVVATELQSVLTRYGAETYLDQDKIQVPDVLPNRIRQGIEWCNNFLLLWSSSAATSEWVGMEWNTAYELRRKIIPYCLDSMSLPPALENLVYVDRKDSQVAHVGLLRAVFGKDFTPSSIEIFPGRWRLTLNAFGLGTATDDLELRANGQITGSGKVDQGGAIDSLIKSLGASDMLNLRFSISGTWGYEEHTEILMLDMVAHGFGQEFREKVQVRTTGREVGEIQGQDFSGRTWKIRRLPSSELKESLLHLERTLAERTLTDFKAVDVTPTTMQRAIDDLSTSVDAVAKHRSAVLQLGKADLGEQFNKICKLGSSFRQVWREQKKYGISGIHITRGLAGVLAENVAKFRNECFGDE